NGDLNRKFASISPKEPDYKAVQRNKGLVLLPEVSMVINLHDGWDFYKPTYIDAMQNPKRWGNSSLIDTSEINASKDPELENIAT
ncbi:deacylase, partial [Campylobacter jejuni]|uniref:M99 family carboxypeptidase catalytic domain-containing protein n=1 Tax=Campylobacter jejuni TaxID=197 RepID=UPI000D5786E3